MIPQQRVNVHDIRKTFELFFVPGACVELRVPNAGRQKTISGYFDDPEKLTQAAAKLSGQVAGVYLTANPANPALLARANNKVVSFAKQTTADTDILSRRWLLLDFDPVRPSGISSTDAEREAAFELARLVRDFLHGAGWPEPVLADSGNGAHLLYRISLANDERATNIIRGCISALAFRFSNNKVSIDQTVYNAARIWKLYGTMSCKGDNTADRPHRLARLLHVPDPVEVVPEELLLELAAMCPRPQEPKPDKSTSTRDFDLARWIKEHNLPVRREKAWPGGGRVWVLNPCPFNPEHTDNSAYIVQFASGAIAAGCHHNGCQGKGWYDLRDVVEPGWREKARRQGEAEGQEKAGALPVIVRLADVAPEPVEWLWEPYIPLGKLTLLEGDPESGKTWLALAIAAAVSTGSGLLGQDGRPGPAFEPGNVLYLTAEDGLADTLRPRLDTLGADVSKIYALTGENGAIVTLSDIATLDTVAVQVKPRLIIIDPIQAYLGAGVDMYRANEVRPVLAKLAGLAEKHSCAVLCIRHLSKSPTGRAIYRGMGSIDFTAAARSVLLAGVDPEDNSRRAMVQIKNSLAAKGVSLGYSLCPPFEWTGISELTKSDLLASEREPEEKSALEEAAEWLQQVLEPGPVDAKEIKRMADDAGISISTLRRAKKKLGVKAEAIKKPDTSGKIKFTGWTWRLPDDQPDTHPGNQSYYTLNDHLEPNTGKPHEYCTSSRCSKENQMIIWKKSSNDAENSVRFPDDHQVSIGNERLKKSNDHLEPEDTEIEVFEI